LNPHVIKDTKFDPLYGIPRPESQTPINRNFNEKDPWAYYDPIGSHKNLVGPKKDALIFSVPVSY